MSKLKACSVLTCLRPARLKGLCSAHHDRLHRYGSLNANTPILSLAIRKNRGSINRKLSHVRP